MSKVLSFEEFAGSLSETKTLALGGFLLENRPSSLVRAVLRAGVHVATVTSGPVGSWDVDVLVAAGLVDRVRVPHVSLGEAGLAPALSAAASSGEVQIDELDEAVLMAAFLAAAEKAPTHRLSGLGPNDVLSDNPLLVRQGNAWWIQLVVATP